MNRRPPLRAVSPALSRAAAGVVLESLEGRRLLAAPSVADLPFAVDPAVGSSVFLPVVTSDADGDAIVSLSASVTDAPDGGNATAEFLPRENRFLQMDVDGFGAMTYELFDNIAPETVGRIAGLADSGFYDGLEIFRVLDGFVFQFGSPTNNGQSGPTQGGPDFTFDDEFDPETLFAGDGQLAMANSGKDTNSSQFFVTDSNTRTLDLNHTLFGQLVGGFDVRDAIMGVDVGGPQNSTPNDAITVSRVRTVANDTDGVVRFIADAPGDYTLTVTATDSTGETTTRDYPLTAVEDTIEAPVRVDGQLVDNDGDGLADLESVVVDDPPILLPLNKNLVTRVGQAVTFDVPATDVDGDDLTYFASFTDVDPTQQAAVTTSDAGTLDVDQDNARVTFTPANGFAGPVAVYVYVNQQGGNAPYVNSQFDEQLVNIGVGGIRLSGSALGVAALPNASLNNARVATFTAEDPSIRADNYAASIDWGDGTVSDGTVTYTGTLAGSSSFDVTGSHDYGTLDADLPLRVTVVGDNGARLEILGQIVATDPIVFDAAARRLTISGGDQADDIRFGRDGDSLTVSVNGVTDSFDSDGVDLVEIFAGGGGDTVVLEADAPNTRVFAGAGDDSVTGGMGNDEIFGEDGDDVLDGFGGNDSMDGGDGDDYLMGGTGIDYDDDTLAAGFFDRDTLLGGDGNDTLSGGLDANTLDGGDGDDLLNGSGSRDTLDGGLGNDRLRGYGNADSLVGGDGDDTLLGDDLDDPDRGGADNGGDDTLEGGDGDDVLFGYFANDLFRGGTGSDTLFGGDGIDTDDDDDASDLLDSIENT